MGIRSSLAASRRPLPDGSQLGWPCSGLSAPALRPRTTVLCFGWSSIVSPILSITTNQRLLPLIQQPLKHPAAPDTLAAVHAAQGHQLAAAARAEIGRAHV